MSEGKKSRGIQGQSENWLRRLVGRSPATAAADKVTQAIVGPSPKRESEGKRHEARLVDETGKAKSPQTDSRKRKS
jgi:hypothetical protein